mmetsp:Transcript_4793/g.11365  ORF Transcript_4793/g.11365 Transcript_4793/m.11365 type:complete len:245 (+) Transcript_4793:6387-7121(+)
MRTDAPLSISIRCFGENILGVLAIWDISTYPPVWVLSCKLLMASASPATRKTCRPIAFLPATVLAPVNWVVLVFGISSSSSFCHGNLGHFRFRFFLLAAVATADSLNSFSVPGGANNNVFPNRSPKFPALVTLIFSCPILLGTSAFFAPLVPIKSLVDFRLLVPISRFMRRFVFLRFSSSAAKLVFNRLLDRLRRIISSSSSLRMRRVPKSSSSSSLKPIRREDRLRPISSSSSLLRLIRLEDL